MFESLDSSLGKSEDQETSDDALLRLGLTMFLTAGTFLLYIVLGDLPYGGRIATLVGYSGAVILPTVFRFRGFQDHQLYDLHVQEQLPRLLKMHFLYLAGIFTLQTFTLHLRPSLPLWWVLSADPNGTPPCDLALHFILVVIGGTELLHSQRILDQAKATEAATKAV